MRVRQRMRFGTLIGDLCVLYTPIRAAEVVITRTSSNR